MKLQLSDETETVHFAQQLANLIEPLNLVTLRGDLGAGKTTLVRALLRALGHQGHVKSPTFTLVEPYEIGGRAIYHFDLYRLADPDELEFIGFKDYLDEQALLLVEWPEKGAGLLPEPDLDLELLHHDFGRTLILNMADPALQQQISDHIKTTT